MGSSWVLKRLVKPGLLLVNHLPFFPNLLALDLAQLHIEIESKCVACDVVGWRLSIMDLGTVVLWQAVNRGRHLTGGFSKASEKGMYYKWNWQNIYT